jgi:hypothetical protein
MAAGQHVEDFFLLEAGGQSDTVGKQPEGLFANVRSAVATQPGGRRNALNPL